MGNFKRAVIIIICVAILCACSEQIEEYEAQKYKEESEEFVPQDLVINTVENGDPMLLDVVCDGEIVFQYKGFVDIYYGDDGFAHGTIYIPGEEAGQ